MIPVTQAGVRRLQSYAIRHNMYLCYGGRDNYCHLCRRRVGMRPHLRYRRRFVGPRRRPRSFWTYPVNRVGPWDRYRNRR